MSDFAPTDYSNPRDLSVYDVQGGNYRFAKGSSRKFKRATNPKKPAKFLTIINNL